MQGGAAHQRQEAGRLCQVSAPAGVAEGSKGRALVTCRHPAPGTWGHELPLLLPCVLPSPPCPALLWRAGQKGAQAVQGEGGARQQCRPARPSQAPGRKGRPGAGPHRPTATPLSCICGRRHDSKRAPPLHPPRPHHHHHHHYHTHTPPHPSPTPPTPTGALRRAPSSPTSGGAWRSGPAASPCPALMCLASDRPPPLGYLYTRRHALCRAAALDAPAGLGRSYAATGAAAAAAHTGLVGALSRQSLLGALSRLESPCSCLCAARVHSADRLTCDS